MPPIWRLHCNKCDFEMPTGWGGCMYAQDETGHRILCRHPGEHSAVRRITGLSVSDAIDQGKVGFESDCICLSCLEKTRLDIEKDSRLCPACSNGIVVSAIELIDKKCPKCGTGKFVRTETDAIR